MNNLNGSVVNAFPNHREEMEEESDSDSDSSYKTPRKETKVDAEASDESEHSSY